MTAKRVLVTGGSGFIGTNAVERLMRDPGVAVLSIDKRPPQRAEAAQVHRPVDLMDLDGLRRAVEQFDPTHVLHLAARTDLDGSGEIDYQENTVGTTNLIASLREAQHLQQAVFASSRLVCRIGYVPQHDLDFVPSHPYGASKAAMEVLIRESDLRAPWTIVRPTSIWGPWFSVPYADFFTHVLAGRYVHPAGVRVRKSFGYVANTVHQLLGILEADATDVAGRVFYLADYEPIEVLTFARHVAAEAAAPRVREVPRSALAVAARIGDLAKRTGVYRHPPLTTFRLNNLCTDMVFDMTSTRTVVPSLPVRQDEGITETLRWLSSQRDTSTADR